MSEDIYKAPEAELIVHNENDKILQFKRFTAWGVFGLTIITFGIYTIYWLITRANNINQCHENKIHDAWIYALPISLVLSIVAEFIPDQGLKDGALIVTNLVYIVSYLSVLFMVRNRLLEIIRSDTDPYFKIGPVLTFFLSCIYLQYKINCAIDNKLNNNG